MDMYWIGFVHAPYTENDNQDNWVGGISTKCHSGVVETYAMTEYEVRLRLDIILKALNKNGLVSGYVRGHSQDDAYDRAMRGI